MKRNPGSSFVIGFCIATAIFFIVGRLTAARKAMHDHPGSVADLVRRGQLKSDRRGMYDSNTPLPLSLALNHDDIYISIGFLCYGDSASSH